MTVNTLWSLSPAVFTCAPVHDSLRIGHSKGFPGKIASVSTRAHPGKNEHVSFSYRSASRLNRRRFRTSAQVFAGGLLGGGYVSYGQTANY
jgi:hypothetical protein